MDKQRNLRTFYTLIITQTFSLIGSRMTEFALGIYLFNQTGEVTPLALVALFSFIPQVAVAGIAGVLADRWDRRYVMILSDTGQAVGTIILLVTFMTGSFQVWMLYLVTFLQAIFGVFQQPAFTASVTMLIPDSQRDRANAIEQLTGPSAGVIAPIFAGVLYAEAGLNGVIGIDLITFVVAVIVVLLIRIPRPDQTAEGRAMQGSLLSESVGGLRFLWKWRSLFALTLQISLVNFLFSGAAILFTPYLLARTGSEATYGTLMGVFSLGAIAGGIVIGLWGGTKPRIHTIMPGIITAAFFLIIVGLAQTPLLLAIALFLTCFPTAMINAVAMSLLQAKVAPDIQGRVFAATGQISRLLIPLAYLLVGPLADNVFEPAVGAAGWDRVAPLVGDSAGAGMGLLIVIAGSVLLVTTSLVYALPRIRHMEAELPDYVAQPANEVNKPLGQAAVPVLD